MGKATSSRKNKAKADEDSVEELPVPPSRKLRKKNKSEDDDPSEEEERNDEEVSASHSSDEEMFLDCLKLKTPHNHNVFFYKGEFTDLKLFESKSPASPCCQVQRWHAWKSGYLSQSESRGCEEQSNRDGPW